MPERLTGEQVVLAPVAEEHVADLRRILDTPEVARHWGPESDGWPFEEDSDDVVRYAVFVDGAVRGFVQYGEEADPMYRHASIDIFLDPSVHGMGIGTDTMRTLARHLVHDLGQHRLVIDPAADNAAAIRCYTAIGFRPVGVMPHALNASFGTSSVSNEAFRAVGYWPR